MTTQPAVTPTPDKKAEAKSSSEKIPSTVVTKFYDEHGALHAVGSSVNYTPKEDMPYPWPLLRPKDESLEEELEAEYKAYHKEKMKKINARGSIRSAFENLSRMQED